MTKAGVINPDAQDRRLQRQRRLWATAFIVTVAGVAGLAEAAWSLPGPTVVWLVAAFLLYLIVATFLVRLNALSLIGESAAVITLALALVAGALLGWEGPVPG